MHPTSTGISASKSKTPKLGEIQALRTVAVLAVVLFHLEPSVFPGGFIGVDAFFVISGFLITSHLFKEVAGRGRIALGRFWARRVRRLLPAAFLVLLATMAGTFLVLPSTVWQQVLTEIGASALYVQNWRLAFDAVDYFAAENLASPVQHYWSLSVEEQFYLVWPLLILAAVGLATVFRRQGVPALRTAVTIAAGVVFAASLIYSIRIAVSEQSFGYFSTFSHAWEFAAGALLALVLPRLTRFDGRGRALRAAASWLGYALIVWSVFSYSGATAFPGYTALAPVFGVLLVIAAGRSTASLAPTRLVELRPVQYIGDISYSLYLWHWPPIVLLPYLTGHPLTLIEKAAILVGAIAAAAVTKVWVEDRFRFGPLTRLSSPKTFLLTAVVSAALVAGCATPILLMQQSAERSMVVAQQALETRPCFGADALLDTSCDPNFRVDGEFGPEFAAADNVSTWMHAHVDDTKEDPTEDCPRIVSGVQQCVYGDPDADAVIALVGDSHARILVPALTSIAQANGWQIRLLWLGACRPVLPEFRSPIDSENVGGCKAWKTQVIDAVARSEDVDLVVTSAATTVYGATMDPKEFDPAAKAFQKTWETWTRAGRRVLVVQDVPISYRKNPLDCIAKNITVTDPCALPIKQASPREPMDMAVQRTHSSMIHSVDLARALCDATTCHFVVGGLITHRDSSHMTNTFTMTLVPLLSDAIREALE